MKIKVIWWIHSAHHFFGSFHLKGILSLGTPQGKPRWCHRYFFVINKVRKVNWTCAVQTDIFLRWRPFWLFTNRPRGEGISNSHPIRHANVLSGRAFTWFCRALHGPFCPWAGRQFANGRCFWRIFVKHFGKRKKNRRGGDFQMRMLMDRPNEKNEFISVLVSLLQKTRSQPCLYTPCIVDEVIFLLYFHDDHVPLKNNFELFDEWK